MQLLAFPFDHIEGEKSKHQFTAVELVNCNPNVLMNAMQEMLTCAVWWQLRPLACSCACDRYVSNVVNTINSKSMITYILNFVQIVVGASFDRDIASG